MVIVNIIILVYKVVKRNVSLQLPVVIICKFLKFVITSPIHVLHARVILLAIFAIEITYISPVPKAPPPKDKAKQTL